jgi:phosphoglycerate kinase
VTVMGLRTLDKAQVAGKRVLVRVDFNAPLAEGRVADDTRLRAALPTIGFLHQKGAQVILMSHLGRPKGQRVASMSLRAVVEPLARLMGAPVAFAEDCVGDLAQAAVRKMADGQVLLLENLRFHPGEERNDPAFARDLAALGDLYVDDAFSAAHRAHASTEGLAHLLPAFAGLAMQRELEQLETVLGSPEPPVMGIIGGAKVSTKLDLLNHLVTRLQRLALGGAMANTFCFAQGHDVGASLQEPEMAANARAILETARASGCEILLPIDVVVGDTQAPDAAPRVIELAAIQAADSIFDLGPASVSQMLQAMDASRTLVWNGPLGVIERPPFDSGTMRALRHAAGRAQSGDLVVVAGGGDTVAALRAAGITDAFDVVSTAGGAFLEWMAGKTLPGVAVLQD